MAIFIMHLVLLEKIMTYFFLLFIIQIVWFLVLGAVRLNSNPFDSKSMNSVERFGHTGPVYGNLNMEYNIFDPICISIFT